MANPFMVVPGNDRTQGLSGIGNVLQNLGEERKLREQQELMAQQQEMARGEMMEAVNSGDINRVNSIAFKYPEFQDQIYKGYGAIQERDKGETLEYLREVVSGGPDNIEATIQKRITLANAGGKDASKWESMLAEYQEKGPEQYFEESKLDYSGLAPKQEFDAFMSSPEQLEMTEYVKKSAELRARRENIGQILNASGDMPEIALSGEAGTGDTRMVSGLFKQAQKLFAAGETGMANNALAQARFIADNSPDIAKQKEMEKPISRELAAELGVPIGTTLGDIVGATLPSPEESAERQAAATARGRGRVASEEQVGFINQASSIIDRLQQEIKTDPGVVGVRGSLRSTGKTAIGVLSDIGAQPVVDAARDIALSQADVPPDQYKSWFDSETLSTLDLMENSLGMIWARLQNPDGRLPVDVIKRSINDMKLSGLRSSEQVNDRLNFIKEMMDLRASAIQRRFGGEDQQAPQAVPKYRLDPQTGTLVEVK